MYDKIIVDVCPQCKETYEVDTAIMEFPQNNKYTWGHYITPKPELHLPISFQMELKDKCPVCKTYAIMIVNSGMIAYFTNRDKLKPTNEQTSEVL